MTQKHWCVRAAREQEEGVKTHRYAVLKGCRERDIVRPPTPVQITPELPTVTVFYSRVARNLVGFDDGDDRVPTHFAFQNSVLKFPNLSVDFQTIFNIN